MFTAQKAKTWVHACVLSFWRGTVCRVSNPSIIDNIHCCLVLLDKPSSWQEQYVADVQKCEALLYVLIEHYNVFLDTFCSGTAIGRCGWLILYAKAFLNVSFYLSPCCCLQYRRELRTSDDLHAASNTSSLAELQEYVPQLGSYSLMSDSLYPVCKLIKKSSFWNSVSELSSRDWNLPAGFKGDWRREKVNKRSRLVGRRVMSYTKDTWLPREQTEAYAILNQLLQLSRERWFLLSLESKYAGRYL